MGCAPGGQPSSDAPTQTAAGGVSQPAENINLKDIDITAQGSNTVVTLSLLSGSRKAGYPESKLTRLPEYEISLLEQPQRLMIKLSNISFWDYTPKQNWAFSEFVLGLFREVPANEKSLIIYIQLSRTAEFTVQESEGDLVVELKPGTENAESKFFCLSNSFYEHQEGLWPQDIDMTPVLCADLENKLLISRPFETRQEAQAFMESANQTLKAVLPDSSLYVSQIGKDALPAFISNADFSAADGRSVVMKDGVMMQTPLLLQNGKYLASAADGRIAFSRRYKPEEPALEQDIYLLSEKLWMLDPNGRVQKIDVPDFYYIDSAAFSADGRYLCLLDVSMENRVLYVYDFVTSVLINLGEEGFGNQTAAFAWSDKSDILYAMTGYGSMQMMSCSFNEDATFNISAVEEAAGSEGRLKVASGRIFFADNAGYSGVIYEIGAKRRKVTEGMDFAVSPDAKTMLVLETSSAGLEEVLTSLKLCDIKTGESKYIVKNALITSFCFSQSGSKVYYTDASLPEEETTGQYKYGLFTYDIASAARQMAALSSTEDFAPSNEPGKIYLIQYFGDTANSFFATYTYDLSK